MGNHLSIQDVNEKAIADAVRSLGSEFDSCAEMIECIEIDGGNEIFLSIEVLCQWTEVRIEKSRKM